MKDFREIQKDAKVHVLMNEIFEMGIHQLVHDVFFCENYIVLMFKGKTPDPLLKELQLIFKATVVLGDGYGNKQFICGI